MGKKVLKLFLDTMLRAAVIILAIAIIVMLVLLAKTVNKNNDKETTTTKEASSIVTEEDDPSDPTFGGEEADVSDEADGAVTDETTEGGDAADSTAANIVVINASGISGVAGSWQTALGSVGYSSVEVGNYLGDTQSTTTVYVSGSYSGSDIVSQFSNASVGQKSELDASLFDVTIDNFDIVVLVGTDNSGNN